MFTVNRINTMKCLLFILRRQGGNAVGFMGIPPEFKPELAAPANNLYSSACFVRIETKSPANWRGLKVTTIQSC
jgi:hypothetical protein